MRMRALLLVRIAVAVGGFHVGRRECSAFAASSLRRRSTRGGGATGNLQHRPHVWLLRFPAASTSSLPSKAEYWTEIAPAVTVVGNSDSYPSRSYTGSNPPTSRVSFLSQAVLALPALTLLAPSAGASIDEPHPSPTTHQMLPLQDHRTYSSSVSPRPSLSFTENALLQTTVRREESISGFFAGAALTLTKTIVKYPLDTATVRLQMPNNTEYSIRNLNRLFANAYVGVEAPLVANVPAGAVFFAVKDAVQSALANPNSNHHQYTISNSFSKTLISVAIAQIPYWILRNPTEVVKTRQQAGQANYYNYNYNSLAAPVAAAAAENGSNTTRRGSSTGGTGGNWKDIAQAYQQVRIDALRQQQQRYMSNSTATVASSYLDGWDAYYTGYWENILYAYPADVIKFQCYEWLSRGGSSNINSQKPKRLSPATGALYGAIATAVAQCVTTPLDVVRNRVMMTPATAAAAPVSYMESLVRLAREEGLAGLFAGVTPRVGKAILSGAIQFATYEETKQEFAKFFLQKKDS